MESTNICRKCLATSQREAWLRFADERDFEWPEAIETLLEERPSSAASCGTGAPFLLHAPQQLCDMVDHPAAGAFADDELIIVIAGKPEKRLLALDYRVRNEEPHLVLVFPETIEHIYTAVEAALSYVIVPEMSQLPRPEGRGLQVKA